MHTKIMNSGDGNVYSNKGSCGDLVNYLEKEDKERAEELGFFDREDDRIEGKEVERGIDGNTTRLNKQETKFYTLSVSPSKEELKQMGKNDRERREALKEYIRKDVMPEYARGFAPDKKGNKVREQDLKWYAKIEHHRYWKGTDKEVRQGKARSGDRKPGKQMHAHIIVSRKTDYGKDKLKELDRSRERKISPNGARKSFSKERFAENCIDRFNRRFERSNEKNLVREARKERENRKATDKERPIVRTPSTRHRKQKEKILNFSLQSGGREMSEREREQARQSRQHLRDLEHDRIERKKRRDEKEREQQKEKKEQQKEKSQKKEKGPRHDQSQERDDEKDKGRGEREGLSL